MASWVTHLIVADQVLAALPWLKRHEFCVGCIAPDCNVENADWSQFTPPREVTHWMGGEKKSADDCDRFVTEYLLRRTEASAEERSFLWGYYCHLVVDAEMQRLVLDEARVADAWKRAEAYPELLRRSEGMERSWQTIKHAVGKENRMKDIYAIERRYLDAHPDSGYFTEIRGLTAFPDYLDYLPKGAIVRKVGVMYYIPEAERSEYPDVALSRQEYEEYMGASVRLTVEGIRQYSSR